MSMSNSAYSTFDLTSFRLYFQFYDMSFQRFVLFDVLSVKLMSHSTFSPSAFLPSAFFIRFFLSVNKMLTLKSVIQFNEAS
jgi:hypothetical protein